MRENFLHLCDLHLLELFHIIFTKCFLSFLGFLPEVWRQLEAVHFARAVTNYQDWFFGVECNLVERSFVG